MRLAYLGTPEPAAVVLRALVAAGHDICCVVTEPDKRRGRGAATSPTPVKMAAAKLGIPVTEDLVDATAAGAELGIVVAFGRLIPRHVLGVLDMVNVHFSLLPSWRGAAPVERSVLAGDTTTGVSLMKLDAGLDTGPVYSKHTVPIEPGQTVADLVSRLAHEGADRLVELLAGGRASLPVPVPQVGEATYAHKITPEDRHLDWSAPAVQVERVVMLGKAFTSFRGARLVIWAGAPSGEPVTGEPGQLSLTATHDLLVATGAGSYRITQLQMEGRQRQDAGAWARGARLTAEDRCT